MPSSSIETINPATGEKTGSYEIFSEERMWRAATRAHETFETNWSKLSVGERSQYLKNLANTLRAKKSKFAEIMTSEIGKPISQSEAEIEKCALTADVYQENAEKWLADELATTDANKSFVMYQPLGTILLIMPWNFPFLQVFRSAIPTLVAGNTVILRHSNVCPGTALAIQGIFGDAGFPEGAFTSIVTQHSSIPRLIESDYISGVAFTGSVEAGQEIAALAARSLKKSVLELGGSDPFIVLEDADISRAAEVGANARLLNAGQNCIAAKRFIVHRAVAKHFLEGLVSEFEKKKVGDPRDKTTDVGPLVNLETLKTVAAQVLDAKSLGADVCVGGSRLDRTGSFYQPTVLDGVSMKMKVMYEEVFGPVAPVYSVSSDEEAIRVANSSEFGLGSSVWTADPKRARRFSEEIQSGMVFINALTKSDPRMPFGGIKKSGIGREFAKYGLKEFVNVKSVNVYGIENF